MTNSLLTSTLLASVIALTACSKLNSTGEAESISASQVKSSSNIVGGSEVPSNDEIAKMTVQIFTLNTATDIFGQVRVLGISGCTGTLLADNIVLTAAHCTAENPNYMFLYFSSQSADLKTLSLKNPLVRRVVGGKVGGNWPKLTDSQEQDWGDIALLRFEGGIPEGYHVAELLPNEIELQVQQTVTLAGFGWTDGIRKTNTDRLLKVEIPVLNPSFGKSEMIVDSGEGKGPCHGDSGGPAYVNVDGKLYVAGTTSRAESSTDPLGQCIGDAVYTKVQPYSTWIKNGMKALQSPNFRPALIPQPKN